MQYQDKPKEKPQSHYAHDGGRFDEVFERKVGKIDKRRNNTGKHGERKL